MAQQQSATYTPRIRDLPTEERPRERLHRYGAAALSTSELLAIILRTGTPGENVINLATRLLSTFRGLAGLAQATYAELGSLQGLGEAKASQLKAALELGKRLSSTSAEERVIIQSPQDVANLLQAEMSLLEQEHLRVLLLNTRNQVLGVPEVYQGNVSTAIVRPRRSVPPRRPRQLPRHHRGAQPPLRRPHP